MTVMTTITAEAPLRGRNDIAPALPALTAGTVIATPRGEIAVEDLRAGDRVLTRDNGMQAIAWVGHKPVGLAEMTATPSLCPVRIAAGALGHGLPESDMVVSGEHRLLIVNDAAQLYFEEREVLVAAKDLVGRPGVTWAAPFATTLVAIAFDSHEVILANGAWTESLDPAHPAKPGPTQTGPAEIYTHFPDMRPAATPPARRKLTAQEVGLL